MCIGVILVSIDFEKKIKHYLNKGPYSFVEWVGEFKGVRTHATLHCPLHGHWLYKNFRNLSESRPNICCPECWKTNNRLSDESMTLRFLNHPNFNPQTKFRRSERLDGEGKRTFWEVVCPDCGEVNESRSSSLRVGSLPCSCGTHRQTYAYIISVKNSTNSWLKYGVTNDYMRRYTEHKNNFKTYTVTLLSVWKFPTKSECYAAERHCRKHLNIVEFKDNSLPGYTEIVEDDHLAFIEDTYKNFNGALIKPPYSPKRMII